MKTLGARSVASILGTVLDVAWYGTLAGIAVFFCLVLYGVAGNVGHMDHVSMDVPIAFSIDLANTPVSAASLGIDAARIERAQGTGLLTFPPPSGAFVAIVAGGVMAMLLAVLWVLGQLRAVFRSLRAGQPFTAANARRVRSIGVAVIAGALAQTLLSFFNHHFVSRHFAAPGLRFDVAPEINLAAVLAGLVILVIAEVFRLGARLEEEQSLTV